MNSISNSRVFILLLLVASVVIFSTNARKLFQIPDQSSGSARGDQSSSSSWEDPRARGSGGAAGLGGQGTGVRSGQYPGGGEVPYYPTAVPPPGVVGEDQEEEEGGGGGSAGVSEQEEAEEGGGSESGSK